MRNVKVMVWTAQAARKPSTVQMRKDNQFQGGRMQAYFGAWEYIMGWGDSPVPAFAVLRRARQRTVVFLVVVLQRSICTAYGAWVC